MSCIKQKKKKKYGNAETPTPKKQKRRLINNCNYIVSLTYLISILLKRFDMSFTFKKCFSNLFAKKMVILLVWTYQTQISNATISYGTTATKLLNFPGLETRNCAKNIRCYFGANYAAHCWCAKWLRLTHHWE